MEPFLREFHNEVPLVPFLYSTLHSLLKQVMETFVKGDMIEKKELSKIDLSARESPIHTKNIDLDLATRDDLRKVKPHVKEVDILL
ncbi:hypothetical protein PR048_029923 [Dryococelus australis]|uniref:Uncharacterized protein n=1 Tax=Dryococelus australis TaxID=614101 RepID=A0ABQ9GAA1_9NEOP|nr:hypothetical protein PR048_029923 [Dryococelus australis]